MVSSGGAENFVQVCMVVRPTKTLFPGFRRLFILEAKIFFYSKICKTPFLFFSFFFLEIEEKKGKSVRGVFKKQRGLKEDGTFFGSFLAFLQ